MSARILREIWIYPVKSLGGIRVSSAEVRAKGLLDDRRWMLVDQEGRFLSQREHQRLCMFRVTREKNSFLINEGEDTLVLERTEPSGSDGLQVQIWDDRVTAVEVSKEKSQWFSDKLSLPVRLVFFPEANSRPVDPKYGQAGEHVSLADGYPLMMISQASLDDLNSRLDQPVKMNRFRPNLILEGTSAFEEDTWGTFKIGENRFKGVKPCGRCVMTTINQETGEVGKEPLATLSRFRKKDASVLFGQNVIPIDHHLIREGDEITFV